MAGVDERLLSVSVAVRAMCFVGMLAALRPDYHVVDWVNFDRRRLEGRLAPAAIEFLAIPRALEDRAAFARAE
jgi:hypothetical protein